MAETNIKISLTSSAGAILATEGKYCDKNITITPQLETKSITENGTYPVSEGYAGYGEITVEVATPEGYIKPEGSITITENGPHDVTEKAQVVVNVEQPQLYAPTLSVSDDTLTIENDEGNGAFVTDYDIYVDGVLKDTVSAVKLPSFTFIDDMETEHIYQFEEGMTWADWIDSDYNTVGAYWDDGSSFLRIPVEHYGDMPVDVYDVNAVIEDGMTIRYSP